MARDNPKIYGNKERKTPSQARAVDNSSAPRNRKGSSHG